jgi:hypothetical protein
VPSDPRSPSGETMPAPWRGAAELAARAPDPASLVFHRLEPLAARALRDEGREVPEELVEAERLGAVFALTASVHLERARAAVSGPLLVVKGPEVAARYPDPALRIFRDLDLLAPDPEAAQRALVEAGFVEVGDPEEYAEAPHLLPLAWPGLPLELEVHARPNWPPWLEAPAAAELLGEAVPSRTGVEGLLAPAPEAHALLVAAHAWTHGPLDRLRDLLDVLLLAAEADPAKLDRLARAWGLDRLWATTVATAGALFLDGAPPRGFRLWGRHLAAVRERTVLERHLARWTAWWSALPPGRAARATLDELRFDLTPDRGETWGRKLRRSGQAVRHAFVRRSEHDRAQGR